MKLKRYIEIVVMAGMIPLSGYAGMPIGADDFEHDTIGAVPSRPAEVNPSSPTPYASASVVDDDANTAGTGKGLHFKDKGGESGVEVQYRISRIADDPPSDTIPNGQFSAVRIDLSFAPLNTADSRQHYLAITLGEYDADLTSAAARFLECRLWDNGTLDFVSLSGPDSLGNTSMEAGNTLIIFANDYARSITYTGPDNNAYDLPADAAAYWLNGSRIDFGGQGYTLLDDRSTAKGTIADSSDNIGRFGIISSAPNTGVEYIFDDILLTDLDFEQIPTNTSRLVQTSPTGLVYAEYANEGQTKAVNTVPDYSGAGYKGGGVPIPFIRSTVTIGNGPGDDTARIQNAINRVSSLPVGPDGFRGAVVLEAGDYTVSSTLKISTDGVVIRGAGSQESGGTRITYTATEKSHLFEVNSSGAGTTEVRGTRTSIRDSYVPVGAKSFRVSDASGYAPGDRIMVQNTINQKWLDDRSNMSQWGWSTGGYSVGYRRTVTAVDGSRITLDVPVVQNIEEQYGGGDIFKYYYSGELKNIGIESLRLESTYASETDEEHGWDAINIKRLQNGWVRQVTARYFGHGCVSISTASKQITVEDCAMLDHKGTTRGGRRYSFSIDESDSILFQRCLTRSGRHDFASGSRTQGPNVFVDCRATDTYNDIGPHHRYATGELYDNIMGGEMNVQNRSYPHRNLRHGWSGAQIMFWNCNAASIACDAPTGGMNWVVGSTAVKRESHRTPYEPFGIWDSHNHAVAPRSLYYAQLTDRLGINALNNVVLPQQKAGNIWAELFLWDGDGLFGSDVLAWADQETIPSVGHPFAVRGVVRNLPMLDRGAAFQWSKVSGPGSVEFTDDTALKTAAICSRAGTYVLELVVDDGVAPARAIVTVNVEDGTPDNVPPAAPSQLDAEAGTAAVRLNWENNSEADLAGYSVYRSTTSGSYGEPLATGLTSSDYVDDSVVSGTTYYYAVTAVDIHTNESAQSGEVSVTPNVVSGVLVFGSGNEGLAGFTPSTADPTQESWSMEPDSVRYINDDPDGVNKGAQGGTRNGSLLRAIALDRSVGASYTMKGVVHLTDGYGDDNNRIGIYLFGDEPDLAAGPGENELGALFLNINTDSANNTLHIVEGLDLRVLATEEKAGTLLDDDLYGTTLIFTAEIEFVDADGIKHIDVTYRLTDENDDVTTVSVQVPAAKYTGRYFGFATQARTRGVTGSDRAAPFTMDYKGFAVTGGVPLEE